MARYGINDGDACAARKVLCQVGKYDAASLQDRRTRFKTVDIQIRIRRKDQYLMEFGEARGGDTLMYWSAEGIISVGSIAEGSAKSPRRRIHRLCARRGTRYDFPTSGRGDGEAMNAERQISKW